MRMEPSAPHKPSRLYVLAGFLFAVLFCYVGLLYNAQVVHYDEYQEQSQRSITKAETPKAAEPSSTATRAMIRMFFQIALASSRRSMVSSSVYCIVNPLSFPDISWR